MDHSALLNDAVIIALMMLALSTFLLVAFGIPLLLQGKDTMSAAARLLVTLDDEVKPTMQELREVTHSLKEIKQLASQRVSEVGHKIEDVSGSLTHVVDSTRKTSSAWGAGLLAGLSAYLGGQDHEHDSEAKRPRQ